MTPTQQLTELCIDIFAHAELDYEVTLGGNGTNAYEASNVAAEVMRILHGGEWEETFQSRVERRRNELEKEHG